jgi:hypothetical protein
VEDNEKPVETPPVVTSEIPQPAEMPPFPQPQPEAPVPTTEQPLVKKPAKKKKPATKKKPAAKKKPVAKKRPAKRAAPKKSGKKLKTVARKVVRKRGRPLMFPDKTIVRMPAGSLKRINTKAKGKGQAQGEYLRDVITRAIGI